MVRRDRALAGVGMTCTGPWTLIEKLKTDRAELLSFFRGSQEIGKLSDHSFLHYIPIQLCLRAIYGCDS